MSRRFEIDAETLPDLPGMMLEMVKAFKYLGGSATIQELDEKVIEIEGVTEAEQAFTMPIDENRTRVIYYLAWAPYEPEVWWRAGQLAEGCLGLD